MFHITCKAKSNIFSPAINRFKIWLKPTSSYQPLPFRKREGQLLRRFTWIKHNFPVASCSSGCCVDWPLERRFSELKASVCVCVCVCVCLCVCVCVFVCLCVSVVGGLQGFTVSFLTYGQVVEDAGLDWGPEYVLRQIGSGSQKEVGEGALENLVQTCLAVPTLSTNPGTEKTRIFFIFFSIPCDMWDLSSLTRDWTHSSCSGNSKS